MEIDEKVKARIYSRLVREYRRTLEYQQQMMIAQQKDSKIEQSMRQRFPNLMNNNTPQQQKMVDNQKQSVAKYVNDSMRDSP
jgi:hypothetical protein